jgi:predicted ester cyclase
MIEEVWNDHDFTNFDEVVADDRFDHMAVPEHQRGVAGERHVIGWLLSVFPNHRFDIEDAAAGGDTVAVRGKVAEHWAVRDDLGMLRQLGVLPP